MESEDKIIEYLILSGALEMAGINAENGEFTYTMTSKMQEVMPDLYKEQLNFVNSEIMGLWEKGFVTFDLFEDDPEFSLTKKCTIADEVSQLSQQERWSLEELKRVLLTR